LGYSHLFQEERIMKKFLLTLAASLTILALLGCPQRKSINDVLADPARFYNDDVIVTGTVTESWGAMGVGAYQIDDGTGKIWIISDNTGVPGKGIKVGSKGRIQSGFSLGGRSFAVVLREKERKRR
jgi:hypothetical protein